MKENAAVFPCVDNCVSIARSVISEAEPMSTSRSGSTLERSEGARRGTAAPRGCTCRCVLLVQNTTPVS